MKLKSLILALSSAMIFTACSDNGQTSEEMKVAQEKSKAIAEQQAIEAAEQATLNVESKEKLEKEKLEQVKKETKKTQEADPYEDIRHMLEKDVHINKNLSEKNVLGAIGLVVGNGYKCDTLSSIIPFPRKVGYYVVCNNYRYSYELEDKGGNWVVTLQ